MCAFTGCGRLLKDPNGQLCELGAGSFGKVVMGIAHGIQVFSPAVPELLPLNTGDSP